MHPENSPTSHTAAPLNPGDLLTEREAAAILNVRVQTLRNWRWKNEGVRFRKIGSKLVRYHRADLLAFIEAGDSGNADAA